MQLPKYSMGVGDRFAHQGKAQLAAIMQAKGQGVTIVPVWNKSNREHQIIGTEPMSTRKEADAAVQALGWYDAYFVDADHVGMKNVDKFIFASNFFTLDVADFIGQKAEDADVASFVENQKKFVDTLHIPGIDESIEVSEDQIKQIAEKYLFAVQEAGRVYRHIIEQKGNDDFVAEVSMDETDEPQTPVELFFILAAIAQEGIPAQTIAPKFTGRFNKGVDYVGDVAQFAKEFESDVAVIQMAIREFDLPESLKLSVHSGSDKFAIYPAIKAALKKFDAGLHLKTAGTTWLEELIGLAEAGGSGLKIAKEVYAAAYQRFDELCKPYATVIDIDPSQLPTPETVNGWSGELYAKTLRHEQTCEAYNPHFRQLLHVGYKVAAEMGDRFLNALKENEHVIATHVSENVYDRHICRLFI